MSGVGLANVGVNPPVWVKDEGVLELGKSYVILQVLGVQAVFFGGLFTRATRVAITSQVNLEYGPTRALKLPSIEHAEEVRSGVPLLPGWQRNILDMVPLTMPTITVNLEFIADVQNQMGLLVNLINRGVFKTALDTLPGANLVAEQVGKITSEMINTFMGGTNHAEHLLTFSGSFNVATGQVNKGVCAIVANTHPDHPLPKQKDQLSIDNHGKLLINGHHIDDLSYVLIGFQSVPTRLLDSVPVDTPWLVKLKAAQSKADMCAADPNAPKAERDAAFAECRQMIADAALLLNQDPGFLEQDRQSYVRQYYKTVHATIFQQGPVEMLGFPEALPGVDAALLGVDTFADLDASLEEYQRRVAETERLLQTMG